MDAIVPSAIGSGNLGLQASREVKGFLWRMTAMSS
jgi:hypothetical protein